MFCNSPSAKQIYNFRILFASQKTTTYSNLLIQHYQLEFSQTNHIHPTPTIRKLITKIPQCDTANTSKLLVRNKF